MALRARVPLRSMAVIHEACTCTRMDSDEFWENPEGGRAEMQVNFESWERTTCHDGLIRDNLYADGIYYVNIPSRNNSFRYISVITL